MKKYFAKYLPVDLKYKSDTDLFIFKVKGKWSKPAYADELVGKQVEAVARVELFLCSKDIVVGDLVYNMHDIFIPWVACDKEPNKKINWGYIEDVNKFCFKSLGTISEDAGWVLEGDDFYEDEVRWLYGEPYAELDLHPIESITWRELVKLKQGNLKDLKYYPPKVAIKGRCGHFH
jgi:hypothetical protein